MSAEDAAPVGEGAEIPHHFSMLPLGDGWYSWNLSEPGRFNSSIEPLRVRRDPDTRDGRPVARLRMVPGRPQSNLRDYVHGGATLTLIDIALFAGARQFGLLNPGIAVTLDLSTQFVGVGRLGEPLDAVVELVRETRKLIFLRGLVVQGPDDRHLVASFAGTIRK